MSNFTFGHSVIEGRMLLLRQNVSAGGKGLDKLYVPYLDAVSRIVHIEKW